MLDVSKFGAAEGGFPIRIKSTVVHAAAFEEAGRGLEVGL